MVGWRRCRGNITYCCLPVAVQHRVLRNLGRRARGVDRYGRDMGGDADSVGVWAGAVC